MSGFGLTYEVFVFFVCFGLIGQSVLAQNGNCEINGVTETDWLTELVIDIKDVDRGESFKNTVSNIPSIANIAYPSNEVNNVNPYASATIENGELVITLLNEFASYEEYETSLTFTMNIDFNCQRSTRKLNVVHKIKDTNNNEPKFMPTESFDYTIYTPTGAGIPVTSLYGDLIVRDIDLTTKSIKFTIEENDFLDIQYDRVDSTKKNHYAKLTTKKVIMGIDDPIVLEITAEDVDETGDPPHTISTTVTLKSDPTTQLPITPEFNNAFYTAVYDGTEVSFDTDIKIVRGYDSSVKFSLDGTGSEYFKVTNNEELVVISLDKPLPDDLKQEYILFSLIATKEETSGANAAIHISFPKDDDIELLFDSSTYKGTYEKGNFTIEKIHLVGLTENTVLTITGELSQYFNPVASDGETIDIVLNEIPSDVLDELIYISLELKATLNNKYALSAILIDVPLKVPERLLKFDKTVYKGSYFYSNQSFEVEEIVLEVGYAEDVEFILSGDFREYFEVESSGNKIQVYIVNGSLPVIGDDYLVLAITAKGDNTIETSSGITIQLGKEREVDLEFEMPYYKGTYYYSNNTFDLPELKLVNGYKEGLSSELSGDSAEYFELENIENIFILTLTKPLPEDLEESYLVMTLTVIGENELTAIAVITINLDKPNMPVLKFDQNVYEGFYFYTNHTLELPIMVLEEGYSDDVKFTISDEWNTYFDVENELNSVQLKIKENLPESLVENQNYITITLVASSGSLSSTFSIITITLLGETEPQNILEFEKSLYEGKYDDDAFTLETIVLEKGYTEEVQFKLSGENSEYFDVKNDGNKIDITLNKPLPEDTVSKSPYDVLLLNAEGPDSIASTFVIIAFPKTDVEVLSFEEAFYKGLYHYGNESLYIPDIELSINVEDNNVTLTLSGEYSPYFIIESEKNIIKLLTKEPLPETLEDIGFLTIELKAEIPNSIPAKTTIIVELIPNNAVAQIQFEQMYYQADYFYQNHTFLSPEIVIIGDIDSGVDTTLEGDYSTYFSTSISGNTVTVEKKESLPESILKEQKYIILTLGAKIPDTKSVYTIITIALNSDEDLNPNNTTLRFQFPLYDAVYDENNLLTIQDIILEEGYSDSVTFGLSGKNSEYFNITAEENIVKVIVIEPLPEAVIASNSYIALILEATFESTSKALTVINVDLPTINLTVILSFESPIYSGYYFYENSSLVAPIIKLDNGYSSDTNFKLVGEWEEYFSIDNEENLIEVKLEQEQLPEILLDNLVIFLEIVAERPNSISVSTVLAITLRGKEALENSVKFESLFYEGTYIKSTLEIEPIKISGYDENVTFVFESEYKEYFKADYVNENVIITMSDLPEEVVDKEEFILLILEAQALPYSDHTTILIRIVKDENVLIVFESSEYNADASNSTLGEILIVKANSNPKVVVNYRLEFEDDYLKSRIQINSVLGIVSLSSYLNGGEYKFTAIAENSNYENASDKSTVFLSVRNTSEIAVNLDPLMITKIVEHAPHDKIYSLEKDMSSTNCTYIISNSWPDVKSWFYINLTSGFLGSYDEIDRENPTISEMSQLQLELTLNCEDRERIKKCNIQPTKQSPKIFDDEPERYWISANNIPYTPDKRYLTLLVEDINDHSPVFVDKSPVVVGYPSSDLVFTIRPPFVTSVQATDEDIGENAAIKYTSSDLYFTIHPETGIVYPKDNALQSLNDEHELTVNAIDRNGDGQSTSLIIQIKPLKTNQVSVIRIKNVLIEDVSEILATISKEAKILIKPLHSIVIPDENINTNNRIYSHLMKVLRSSHLTRDDLGSYLNIIIYGLDDNLAIIDSSEMTDKLNAISSTTIPWIIETVELKDTIFMEMRYEGDSNNTGLIVAVSILGSLLFLAIAGFCIWFFLIFSRTYRRMSDASSTSSDTSSSNDSEDSKSAIVDEEDNKSAQSYPMDNQQLASNLDSVITPGKFTKEVRMSPPLQSKNKLRNDTFDYGDDFKDKKKPVVTFKETVQQIEVEDYEVERL